MRRIIKKSDFKLTPWKSGTGLTSEIDIYPRNADFKFDDFEWRLSSAKISSENIFSTFPGYDRLLFILSGEGLVLDGQRFIRHEIFQFPGEQAIQCSVVGEPVEDLGLIFKRGVCRGDMEILEFRDQTDLNLPKGTYFLKDLSSGDKGVLNEVLKIEGPEIYTVRAPSFPVKYLKISILL